MQKNVDCGKEPENCMGSAKDNPIYEVVRQCVGKKLFLFAIIAFSIAVVLTVADNFTYAISYESNFWSIFTRVGINVEFFSTSFFYLSLPFYIVPPIVLAVSMWITYFTIKTGQIGIKILRVMMVLYVVLAFVAIVRTILTILSLAALWGMDFVALIQCIVMIIPFAAAIAFMAVYYLMVFKLLGKVKTMLATGVATRVPRFVGIVSIVLGSFSVIYTFILTFSELGSKYIQLNNLFLSAGINLASALATILFGAFLLSVGEKINDLVKIM